MYESVLIKKYIPTLHIFSIHLTFQLFNKNAFLTSFVCRENPGIAD